MPKTKISEFSATPGNNTDIDGINIAEGCAPSGINDAIRELMAQLKDFQAGTAGDSFNGPVGTTTAAAGAFTTLSATGATTLSSTLAFNSNASVPTATAFAFQPTNNAIAFGTANTERMRINSDGNVGIQNTGPSSYSAVNADNLVVGPNSGSNGITVVSGTTGTGNLAFADGIGTGGTSDYAGLVQYDHSADNMNFFTGATERMRLNSSGLIAPAEVYRTTASSYLRLSGGDGAGSGANVIAFGQSHATAPGRLSLSSVGTGDIISNTISGTHIYQINGSEQARLTSTGLGIGTSSPAQTLHVKTSTAATPITLGVLSNSTTLPALSFNGAYASTTMAGTYSLTGSLYTTVPSGAAQYFSIADSIKLTLDSSGNLGLGVTPSAWGSGTRGFDIGSGSAIWNPGSGNQTHILTNAYNDGTNYIYRNSSNASRYAMVGNAHQWHIAPSGTAGNAITFTQAMTLDASGNLGVGTTSPSTRIHAVATGGAIRMQDSTGTAKYVQMRSDSTNSHLEHIGGPGDALRINNQAAGTVEFFTSNTERARITSGGDLLVGTTSGTGYKLRVYEGGANLNASIFTNQTAAYATHELWNQATSGDNIFSKFYTEGAATARGSIDYNRAGGLTRYNTTSDYRAKDIIGPVQDTGATIDALKVYEGVMKGATQPRPMMIAHEAQAVVPFCVSGAKDEVNEDGTPKYQQMDHASLVPLLIAEIQSLRQRVAALEAK